jgi:hypothetical protein
MGISLPSSCLAIGARGQFIYKSFSFVAKFTRVLNRFRQLLKLAGLACFATHRCARRVFTRGTRLAHGGGQCVLFLVFSIQTINTSQCLGIEFFPGGTSFARGRNIIFVLVFPISATNAGGCTQVPGFASITGRRGLCVVGERKKEDALQQQQQ